MDELEKKVVFTEAFEKHKLKPAFARIKEDLKDGLYVKLQDEAILRFINGKPELFKVEDENTPLFYGAKKMDLESWLNDKMKKYAEWIPERKPNRKPPPTKTELKYPDNQHIRDLHRSRVEFGID
ncbi:hypothetical protein ACFLU5_11390 [Bacteroidota bacterium]